MSIQDVATFALIGLAVCYVLTRVRQMWRGRPGSCGTGCGSCPSQAEQPPVPLSLPQARRSLL